jgi:hypothetical protein
MSPSKLLSIATGSCSNFISLMIPFIPPREKMKENKGIAANCRGNEHLPNSPRLPSVPSRSSVVIWLLF